MELKGCITQADSLEELYKNMEEALNLYLDEPESSTVFFPMPDKNLKGENIVEIPVNPKIGFALAMRMLRRRRGLTQSQIAKLLGMKNIYSCQSTIREFQKCKSFTYHPCKDKAGISRIEDR